MTNWNTFDLNLLVVFDTVVQEKNLTRTGQRLGLTQSAVSHALARLRHMLKDELFVRTPDIDDVIGGDAGPRQLK